MAASCGGTGTAVTRSLSTPLLDQVQTPDDLRLLAESELLQLASELRAETIDAVSVAPGGAHPSYAHGYYDRDNQFYVGWEAISRDREVFAAWIERHVLGTSDVEEYRRSLERVAA